MKKYLVIILLLALAGCSPSHPVYDCSKRASRQSEKHAYKSIAKCPDAFVDIYGKRFPMQSDTVYSSVTVPGVEVVRWDTAWVTDTIRMPGLPPKVQKLPIITQYVTRHDVTTNWITKTDVTLLNQTKKSYEGALKMASDRGDLIVKLWVALFITIGLLVVAIVGRVRGR